MRRSLTLALIVLVAIGAGWWAVAQWGARSPGSLSTLQSPGAAEHIFVGGILDPPRAAPDFILLDQRGATYRLSDQVGDVVVLFFGYTTCPDVCPTTLAQYRQVKNLLGEDADRVQFVFVTVDPERDTPDRLDQYISLFDREFHGLTGDVEALQAVWRDYGVYVERVEAPDSPVGYWMNHSSVSYVVDPKGDLRLIHLYNTPNDDIVHDLRLLLAGA